MRQQEFDDLTRPFLGLPLSRLWRGYGSALYVEVGPLSLRYPRSNHPKAERSLEFGWTWRVETSRSILFGSSSSDQRISQGLKPLENLVIEGISLGGRLPELHLKLSGGRWLSSFAASESQPEWTVFLPDGSWITVRGGRLKRETGKRFAIVRADPSQS